MVVDTNNFDLSLFNVVYFEIDIKMKNILENKL